MNLIVWETLDCRTVNLCNFREPERRIVSYSCYLFMTRERVGERVSERKKERK